ncbi:MAG: magnesium-translocating P-type ATPase [Legionella sp.]|jgi:Mg2+-importing ATPase
MDMDKLVRLSTSDTLRSLDTSILGLSTSAADIRKKQYGTNEVAQQDERSHILIALSHSTNPLVAILLIAALISALTGGISNAAIIIIIVLMSIILDYIQSHRSLVAAKRLQEQVAATACVLRDGVWVFLPCKELVPGDIIRLVAGNMVPADCRLLESKDLHVQQAALTGESFPVEKEAIQLSSNPQKQATAINAVFFGSSIVSGKATALVINTGKNTSFGAIAQSLRTKAPLTEFDKGITNFGLFIMKTIFVMVVLVMSINFLLHRSVLESLMFAMALAVGLTPELLPMITTVTLATGAVRMAKKKVIVKNLSAIQNFGSIDILCCDKTGTLTSGEMILEQAIDTEGTNSEHVLLLAYLNSLYATGIQNDLDTAIIKNNAVNPLDAAILKHDHPDLQEYFKIDEIPFDFERRCASVVVNKNKEHILIAKGAPEYVLQACTDYRLGTISKPFDDKAQKLCKDTFLALSSQGYRVLAIAYRSISPQSKYTLKDERDLTLAGFIAFIDPPLSDVGDTIKAMNAEGVQIKIITGDNDLVAAHVCKEVGLDPSKIILGDTLDHMNDAALATIGEQTQIFARISPSQKQRIISALRSRGHVVGYIGDGINDAPSLHSADVGISASGAVDIAREAADIVLLQNNLSVLLDGILEGRKSFGNVMKYLMMGTSSNFGNMLSMAVAILFLPFLPMLPSQILLNNLLYDISQITIPTDNVDESFIRKPKHWDIGIIRTFMFYIGPISSIFDFLTFFIMLKVFAASEALFQTGWFVESLATQTLVVFVIRTVKNPWQSKPSIPLITTVLLCVAIGIILPFTPIAQFFGFIPLPATYFLFLILATMTYLFLVEKIKKRLMWKWI